MAQTRDNGLRHRKIRNHADLNAVRIDIRKNTVELSRDEICADGQNTLDPQRVLCGQRCDDAHAI